MHRFAQFCCLPIASMAAAGVVAAGPAEESRLLIIAPKAFAEGLAGYAAQRRRELPTELVSLEEAVAGGSKLLQRSADAPSDDAERLKRFLFQQWRERSVAYVLLVGDADVMPVRYMCLDRVTAPAFDYAFYPSDLYYADLAKRDGSFEDWNAQRDGFHAGYFGEVRGEKNKGEPINFDQIDYLPEIAVGRWPVSTAEEAAAVARKVMRHVETIAGLQQNQSAAAPRAAMIACGGWIENRPMMDELATTMERGGWSIEKRYFAGGSRSDDTPPPDAAQVIALVNAGSALVMHSGHGSDDRWEHSIGVASIAEMRGRDGRLPMLISAGCSTARLATLPPYEGYVDVHGVEHAGTNAGQVFGEPPPPPACYQKGKHNPTGLGEELLRAAEGGAIAYIGCNTGSQPCGMTLLEGFARALAERGNDRARLGDCWNAAITHYWHAQRLADLKPVEGEWYPPSIFFQGMKFMLFGDPSLTVR